MNRRGGGVFIYMRENFKCLQFKTVNMECLALNVILSSNMKFYLIVLYNPPCHDEVFFYELKNLLSIVDDHCECMIFGDFNIICMDKNSKSQLKSKYGQIWYIYTIN